MTKDIMLAGNSAHILAYPLPLSGHIIPFLDFARLLLRRGGFTITILTSPNELPLLQPLLSAYPSSLHTLVLSPPDYPFTIHPMITYMLATYELFDPIVEWFRSHASPPVAIISDFLLGWTQELATHLGVPRVAFSPSGAFTCSVFYSVWRELPRSSDPGNENAPLSFPDIPNSPTYPWWQQTQLSRHYKEGDSAWEFFRSCVLANMESWGMVFNTFYHFEGEYMDYLKRKLGHNRVWAVGPLLPEKDDPASRGGRCGSSALPPHEVMTWLDGKFTDSVVYICFGTLFVLSDEQMGALVSALESSKADFILCVKGSNSTLPPGFEDRVAGRGFVIREWAPQLEILSHRSVGAFVTHCGWNSVLEGLAMGVMMLAWPIGVDQFDNAKLIVDQLGVATRVCVGGPLSVPDSNELARQLDESVIGNRPQKVVEALKLQDATVEASLLDGHANGNQPEKAEAMVRQDAPAEAHLLVEPFICNRSEKDKAMELRDAAIEAIKGGSSKKDLDTFVKLLSEFGT